jgi:DNA-binding transcriptional ArsR family regulator
MTGDTNQAVLDRTFGALSDRHRRAILARLAKGPATVNEIAEPFDITLQAVSRHLKVLEAAGLISRTREAQWRRCALSPEPLRVADDWIAAYRQFWEETFDNLETYLREVDPDD